MSAVCGSPQNTRYLVLDLLYVQYGEPNAISALLCLLCPFMEWTLKRIDHWFTLNVTKSCAWNTDSEMACSRDRSATQSWRNGPIRCTRCLRPCRWRPTCLTWTAFCPISLTPCSPWHKSHVPGPVTDVTVSSQHFQSDFQMWLCTERHQMIDRV